MNKTTLLTVLLFLATAPAITAQQGLSLDGSDDYVSFSFAPPTGSSARTVEAWILTTANCNPSNGGTQDVILDWGTTSPLGSRFTFNVLWNNAIRLEVGGNGISGTIPVNDSVWHHVAAVYDPTATNTVSLFVDGVLDASGTPTYPVNTANSNFRIGRRVDDVKYFEGLIDEVRVWNVARTQAEIVANMNAEFCSLPSGLVAYYTFNQGTAGGNNAGLTTLNDNSGNGNPGTLNNFALTGGFSNWVAGVPIAGGSTSSSIQGYGCVTYTSPSGNHTWTSSGIYTDTIPNTAGCDSVITIDLTMVQVDVALGLVGITLNANANNASYQWLDCNNNYAVIPGDTNQYFTPTVNGNYACIVTQNGCSDTSICVPITTVDLNENQTYPGLSIFPNPAENGVFNLSFPATPKASIDIHNINGQHVFSTLVLNQENSRIQLEKKGVYILRFKSEDQCWYRKLIVR